jgi:hypothetical protein
MGKRELLLVIAFVLVGVVVYQATAPPPPPGAQGFSFSKLIDHVRREVRGNRASAELTRTDSVPLTADVEEVRILAGNGGYAELLIAGEERTDVATSLRVHSNAYDDEEARKTAAATVVKADRTATSVAYRINYPREGRQRAFLTMKVPARVRVRIETAASKLVVENVAGVEMSNVRGELTVQKIAGAVTVIGHRGGAVRIAGAGSVKFQGRGTDVTLLDVGGEAQVTLEQGGELDASDVVGPVTLSARHAELTLQGSPRMRGPVRITANNGSVSLRDITVETRLEGHDAELELGMAAAAPVEITSQGGEITLAPPARGYRLDALVVNGRITPETVLKELGLEFSHAPDSDEMRVSGAVHGGGPTITVRSSHSDLTVRAAANRADAAADAEKIEKDSAPGRSK